ncbi:MAG: hypothetical protein JOY61_11705 [Chloroflexi bacterium]|nr:hypothetical protein [Chloroflexota bacterium]
MFTPPQVQRAINMDTVTRASWTAASQARGYRRSTALGEIDKAVEAWNYARTGLMVTPAAMRQALQNISAAIEAWRSSKDGRGSRRDTAVEDLASSVTARLQQLSAPGAAVDTTSAYAQAALRFWSSASQTAPLTDLTDHLVDFANARLPHPMKKVYAGGGANTLGSFDGKTWTITIWTGKFTTRSNVSTVPQLQDQEVAAIANLVFHEARHAEQHFRIAQLPQGRNVGYPPEVYQAASRAPQMPAADREQAQGWAAFQRGGSYNNYRIETIQIGDAAYALAKDLQDLRQTAAPTGLQAHLAAVKQKATFYPREETRIRRSAQLRQIDNDVLTHVGNISAAVTALDQPFLTLGQHWSAQNMKSAFDAAMDVRRVADAAYRAFPHEADAMSAGETAGQTFMSEATAQAQAQTPVPPTPVLPPTPTPLIEPTPEPVSQPTPEPVNQPIPEPVSEPPPEPVIEPTPEPVSEPPPEPVIVPTPEPVATDVPSTSTPPTTVTDSTVEPTAVTDEEPSVPRELAPV